MSLFTSRDQYNIKWMDFTEDSLKTLAYDKTKITLVFRPVVVSDRLTFKQEVSVNRSYAFKNCGPAVVPCFRSRMEVSRSTFADVFMYERTRLPGDFGTYRDVPKALDKRALNSFRRVPARFPAFEGYFDSLYAANRSYAEDVAPEMLNRVLPFERVFDPKLAEEIKSMDFTEYGMDADSGDGFNDLGDDE